MPNYCSVSAGRRSCAHCLALLVSLLAGVGCGSTEEGTVKVPSATRESLAPQASSPKNKDGAPGQSKIFSPKGRMNMAPAAPPEAPKK